MRSPEVGDIWKCYFAEYRNDAHHLLIVAKPKRSYDHWTINVLELNGAIAGSVTEWVIYDDGVATWEKVA
jgi:hypothetical protein